MKSVKKLFAVLFFSSTLMLGCTGVNVPDSVKDQVKEAAEKAQEAIDNNQKQGEETTTENKEENKETTEPAKEEDKSAEIEDAFSPYAPDSIKVGTKWTYVLKDSSLSAIGNINIPGVSIPTEFETSIEITKIEGDTVGVKVTTNTPAGTQTFEQTTTKSMKPVVKGVDNINFKFVGEESVTVPAGSYTAGKFTADVEQDGAKMKMTWWMAKGVGNVKTLSEITSPVATTSTVELKSFTP